MARFSKRKCTAGDDMPAIVEDTREQLPYLFDGSVRACLPTGDYSLQGFESRVAIERKSLDDAFGSVGHGRDRFKRELERLAQMDFGAIVIESTIEQFCLGTGRAMNPRAALHSFLSWSVELGIHVHFAGSRHIARALVFHLLRHWWKKNKPPGVAPLAASKTPRGMACKLVARGLVVS